MLLMLDARCLVAIIAVQALRFVHRFSIAMMEGVQFRVHVLFYLLPIVSVGNLLPHPNLPAC